MTYWRLIPVSTQDTTAVAFPTKPMHFAELKKSLLLAWRKLDYLTVVAAISQWFHHLSACGHFEHIL